MRATFFREAVDKYYDMMQEGEVFIISGGRVKPAFRGSGYELNLDSRTEVEHVRDDTGIKQQVYDFVELSRLEAVPTKEVVDVIGVVKSSGSLANITTRTGRELLKLDLDLVDQSNTEVRTTLWGETAQACAEKVTTQPVLAIKGVRVGDFGGVSLSTTTSSQVSFNPDLPEAAALRQWFDAGGAQQASRKLTSAGGGGGGPTTPLEDIPIAERNTISDLNSGAIGLGEKARSRPHPPSILLPLTALSRCHSRTGSSSAASSATSSPTSCPTRPARRSMRAGSAARRSSSCVSRSLVRPPP